MGDNVLNFDKGCVTLVDVCKKSIELIVHFIVLQFYNK